MNKQVLIEIRARLNALPNLGCRWKSDGGTVLDIRDCSIAEVTSLARRAVTDFIVNAPEDIAHLLAEVTRLQAEAAAMRKALEEIQDEAETDLDRDIILTACQSALATDVGREPLERLRRAEGERDEARRALTAVHDSQLAILGRKG